MFETNKTPGRKLIRADQLKPHPEVQKKVRMAHVKWIMRNFNPLGLGVLTVSRRHDGQLLVVDGQHRLLALFEMGRTTMQVQCIIYDGLTLAQEAELFRLLDKTTRSTAFDDFKAGRLADDSECLAIDQIVSDAGFQVLDQTRDGIISAVTALRKTYRAGANGDGPQVLADTLTTIRGAWGTRAEGLQGPVLAGIGIVYATYNDELDKAVLVRKLAKYPGGPSALVGHAKGLKDIRRTSIAQAVAEIVVSSYDVGRRKRLGTPA